MSAPTPPSSSTPAPQPPPGTGTGTAAATGTAASGPADVVDPTPVVDEEGRIRSGKLAGRTLPQAILILALPVLLEQLANAFVGLVDKMIAGRLPDEIVRPALDGVGLASYVGWFTSVAISAIGIGGMALIARAIGAGDAEQAHRSLGQSLTFGVAWGSLVGGVMWFACPLLVIVGGLSPQASDYFIDYIRLIALGMPATSFLLVSMNCLHGAGETTRPFLIMIVVNIVNIVSSWIFAGVPLHVGGLHVENPFGIDAHVLGIAAGTVTARTVGAILIFLLMRRGITDLRLDYADLRPHVETLRRIIRVGLPSFFDGIGLWAGQLLAVIYVINRIAAETGRSEGLLGAHEIAVQWEAFSFLPGFALGVAAGSLAGQYLGAGNPRMATRAVAWCVVVGMILMGSVGVGFMLFGESLVRLISDDPLHLAITPRLLFICGSIQIFFALAMILRGALRGAGDTRASMCITWFTTYCVRIPLAWTLGYVLGGGLVGLWIGMCIEIVIRGLLFLGRFIQGHWKTVEV